MSDERYAHYEGLDVHRPEDGILRVGMRLDRVEQGHGDLGRLLADVSSDPEIQVLIVGGDREDREDTSDFMRRVPKEWDLRMRVMQEASDLVYNTINCTKPVVSVFPGAVAPVGLVADISIAGRTATLIDVHTGYGVVAGDHAVMSWPLLCGMAKAKYHLMTGEPITGEEAERIGLVSLCVDDDSIEDEALAVARRLRDGSQRAIRWTKHALNNWFRSAGPAFDASLALEFITFSGPDVEEGIDALMNGRPAAFPERY